ncbi:MAG TPA: aromatic ring-hydroxylating dioxygenase subunit alpha [Rubrivivax sp.]|nr:aromatic ring-hydroxylating dioxygenase subunit alpha [Rubrivivax sp.]
MQKDTQTRLMRRVLAHMEARTTDLAPDIHRVSNAHYASPEQLAAEEALLFRDYPLVMGMSCQIPNAGDRFTNDLTGIPILVMRGHDGVVRAFLNACAHRGARVAEGCGGGRAVVCPYHGWAYNTDGSLRGVPDQGSFPGIEKGKLGLRPLPAVEANGMIWVIPNPERPPTAIDIPFFLGELDGELRSYDLAHQHHYETREIRHRMNWKLAIDTFLEPYHLGVLHRDTVGPLFISNLCLFDAFGDHLREVLPRRSMDEQRLLPETEWDFIANNTLVYVLFPNTVFVVQVDHIETWRVFPVRGKVDECVMYLDFFVPTPIDSDSARRHWSRNMDLTIRTVCEEDFPTCEGMQIGYNAGARKELIYGRNEPALAYFQQRIRQSLAQAR